MRKGNMLSEFGQLLIKNGISDKTKFEVINKLYCDDVKRLSYGVQIIGIRDKFKIRMFNYLMRKLIKGDDTEALALAFLILSHEDYSSKMKKLVHRYLIIYSSSEIQKHKDNKEMLSDILSKFGAKNEF